MFRRCVAVAAIALLALLAGAARVARADDARPPDAPAPAPKPAGVVTKPPKLLQAAAPEYPPAALAAGKTAKVKVRIHIDAEGIVTSVDVLEPVGEGFDEAAVAAAMQYVFEPAEIDGKPGEIAVETAINFVIEQQPEQAPPAPSPASGEDHGGPPNHAGAISAPVTLQGTALERGTRRKLAGVIVAVVGPEPATAALDAVTGDDGSFYFHDLPPGNYRLVASDPRFDRFERPIVIAKREAVEVRLWMRPRGGNPYETVVEGERDQLEVTKRTLDRQQLRNVPGTFGDPIRAIQTLPGLARTPFGLGFLLVRGSNPDDTGIFLDGHEVPSLFHFLGGPSVFNVEMLDSMSLYPGGFPARFGRHHGGAVALESRPSKSDGIHGSAKADFLDAGGYIRAPLSDDVSIAAAGRRSYIDAFLNAVLPQPSTGARRIVTPVYYDYQGRIDWNLHDNGRLSLMVLGSQDSLHVIDQDPNAPVSDALDSAIGFVRVIADYTRPLAGDLKLTLSPAYGQDSVTASGAQAAADGPFSQLAIINYDFSYRMRVHGKVGERFTLDTGLDLLSRVTSYNLLAPIGDTIIQTSGVNIPPEQVFRGSQMLGTGAYIDLGIDVTDRLRLVTSMRGDAYILDGMYRESLDPRIVARYRIDDQWTIKGYVGRFSQPPEPEALDRRFGNTNVGIEHGYHYGLGYEWRPDRLWSVDSEFYYVDRRDLVEFTDAVNMNADGTFSYVNFDNGGHRIAYGFEMLIRREITDKLYGWLSYTYSKSKILTDGVWLPTTFDQPHVLNAIASYKPGAGFELGARLQLASGRPVTPVISATYDADQGAYVPVYGAKDSERLPTFIQLDVRAERTWLFDRWSLGVYLDVINVLDHTNVEAIQYDYRYRESAPITSFPIIPSLGVRGTW